MDDTLIDLSGKSMSELVALYNSKAEMMDGIKPVTRFADRTTAEKRVSTLINRVGSVAAKMPAAEVEKVPPVETTVAAVTKPAASAETEKEDEMATKTKTRTKTAKTNGKPKTARVRKPKVDGALVGKGSFREKLLNYLQGETHFKKQNAISKILVAVYGENRKDFRAPLMMVMKGLTAVLTVNRTGLEIRKTRENKENHFGLYNRTDAKA